MQERRNYKRYDLEFLDIHGEVPFASNVNILDISLSGVLIETDKSPEMGHRYILKLGSESEVLTLEGIVIRSTLDKSNNNSQGNIVPIYTAGIHFTKLNHEKIIKIAKIIKDCILIDENESEPHRMGLNFIDMSAEEKELFTETFLSMNK